MNKPRIFRQNWAGRCRGDYLHVYLGSI